MTFEQLLYAEVMSHYTSMQEAADALHISKTGLSLAISQLEDELNVKIFKRTSKGTTVTEAGLQLLSTISQILQSKANLEKLASFSNGANQKTVIRIRYINTMFTAFMDQFINHYDERYRNTFYDISRADTKSIIQLVRNGEIDAGFIASSNVESEWIKDLFFKPVCHGKSVLAVSKSCDLLNKTITFEDLKKQKFCIYDDIYHEVLFDRLQYLCGPLNLILKTDDHWAIAEAITKLNAVCIGRSLQAVLSRESPIDEYVTIDIGHLINDNTTLGWLINPRVEQSGLVHDLIDNITAEIKRSVSSLNREP